MTIFIVLALGMGLSTRLYFFRESFLAELAISFLPYFATGFSIVAIITVVLFLLRRHKKPRTTRRKIETSFLAGFFLRSTALGMLYGSEFFNFYALRENPVPASSGLNIYYANILYTNEDYTSLEKQIEKADPDVVVLVEFSTDHANAMQDFFQERFPYMNGVSRSSLVAGNMVFSKYPLTDMLKNHPYKSGRRRANYVAITYEGEEYYFYVVHTSAPVSEYNFQMRNQQLKKLKEDILSQAQERPDNAKVIVLGDFNLSPWSAFYEKFLQGIEDRLINVFQGEKPVSTRSLWDQKILNVHIDQVFTSPSVRSSNIVVSDLPGSDHNGITLTIQ
ncbi:MAG: endonuclease/exonuclease/phosphatase family protein [Candidatus Peribacteria bacterium]|jgi:endonuclease/exonuclease/phosphatase (EEP) superfamily protein YafD|nr:endonuclease/exonuclease/phosphatase family protein [Candidatus Peribacteria bacterium]